MRVRQVVVFALAFASWVLAPAPGAAREYSALGGDYSPAPRLRDEIALSQRIARVKIVSRTAYNRVTEQPPCGFLYRAEIVDAIKGGTAPLVFFEGPSDDFVDLGRDYLVFVHHRDDALAQRALDVLRDSLTPAQLQALACEISIPEFVPASYQVLIPLRTSDTGNILIGPANRSTPWVCDGNEEHELVPSGPRVKGTSWSMVRDEIRANLSASSNSSC
jgi:hypothetical protein